VRCVRGRHEGDETAHQQGRGDGEGEALLRGVFVPSVVETTQARLGDGPAGARAGEALQALPVVAVHGGVGMQDFATVLAPIP
jgi:hypothetical protein